MRLARRGDAVELSARGVTSASAGVAERSDGRVVGACRRAPAGEGAPVRGIELDPQAFAAVRTVGPTGLCVLERAADG